VVAECLELGDGALTHSIGVAVDEEVAAELMVVAVVGEQVPGDDQDRVSDSDGSLLLAEAASQAPKLRRQLGVARPGRGPGALGEHVAQPAVALVVLPERRLPPVTLLPGQRPAHEARWPAVGNTDMSTPISAITHSAARLPTPVMVSR
jgi:hypothetical protein